MSYKVEYERLDETVDLLSQAVDSWLKENERLDSSVKAIIGSSNISGSAADSLKSYLSYSYPLINRSFSDLVKLFIDNLIIYRQDYYGSIDPDSATVIHDRELFTIKDQIRMWDSEASNVGAEAQSVAASVSDLVAFPSLDTNMVNAAAKIITQKIENLDADINSLENKHLGSDFSSIDAMINSLNAVVKELSGKNRDFKTSFNAASMKSLNGIPALMAAEVAVKNDLSAKQSEAKLALDLENARIQKEAEAARAAREKKATIAKWVLTGAVAVASAAIIISTGGLAAPVIVGAVSGAVLGAFNTGADEYTEKGWETDDWEWGRIGKDAVVGGISGAITGFAGPDAGIIKTVALNAGSEAFSSTVTSIYDQYSQYGYINDWSEVGKEAGIGAIKGTVKGTVGKAFGALKDVGDPITESNVAERVLSGTASKIATGGTTRFYMGFIEYDETEAPDSNALKSAWENATKPEEIVKDAFSGFGKGIGNEIGKHMPGYIDFEKTSNSNAERKILEEMEKNGEFDVSKKEIISSVSVAKTPSVYHGNPSEITLSEAFNDPDLFKDNEAGVYTYSNSDAGKIASGSLKIADNPERNSYAQRTVGGEFRQENDQGGHLIGARFGGDGGMVNLEAQNANVNQIGYKDLENEWAKSLENGDKVYVHIETSRPEGSGRPDAYMGYSITEHPDGSRDFDTFSFQNDSYAEQDSWNEIIDSETR